MRSCHSRRAVLLAAASLAASPAPGETRARISTLIGTGTAGMAADGENADTAKLNNPFGVIIGPDKALYLAALKNTIPMYSTTGRMDSKGAQAVLDVFAKSSPEVAKAKIDLSRTYTNAFVERAAQKLGMQ